MVGRLQPPKPKTSVPTSRRDSGNLISDMRIPECESSELPQLCSWSQQTAKNERFLVGPSWCRFNASVNVTAACSGTSFGSFSLEGSPHRALQSIHGVFPHLGRVVAVSGGVEAAKETAIV